MSAAMQIEGVGLKRGNRMVLSGVGFALQPGELLVIAGPNGVGKSTLLAAMAGDFAPDQGRILLDGRSLSGFSALQLARRRALLPQASRLGFALPARDVVQLGRLPWAGQSESRRDREAVQAALDFADAMHLADRSYALLSGGEQQRVQLARAAAQLEFTNHPHSNIKAPILLLDEPTASLDPAQAHGLLARARDLARKGAAVAAVLHDLALAYAYADRVALLSQGRLLALDKPEAAMSAANLGQAFGIRAELQEGALIIRGPLAA